MSKTYSVICQHVVGNSFSGFSVVYADDGQRFETREAAIAHGFKQGRSDDFNVGVYEDGNLVSIDWMNEPVDTDPDFLHRVQHERSNPMSTEKKDGGPTFPTEWGQDGLTIRDWFAGQMLPRMGTGWPNDENKMLLARRCYEIADAMLAAREA